MDVSVWTVAIGAGLLGIAIKLVCDEVQRSKGPPGPRHVSAFGGLLVTLSSRKPAELGKYFDALRKSYGDVFSLTLGSQTAVVINGYRNIEEALCNPKYCLNGRPKIIWTEITQGKGLFSSDGHLWKEQRKAVTQMLHKLRYDETSRCEDAVQNEANELCTGLLSAAAGGIADKQQSAGSCGSVEPQCLLDAALCNVSSTVLLGRRFEASDPFFKAVSMLLDDVFLHAGLQNMANYIHLLRYLPGDPYKYHMLKSHAGTAVTYMQGVIAERKSYLEESDYSDPATFIDAYLTKIREHSNDPGSTFTDDQLLIAGVDLFAMSIEAASTTLRWALLLLAKNQAVQSRLHAEIEAVIGSNRAPKYADREQMPYMRAFVTELHRYANVVALNLPHCATEDTSFNGYAIKKGTIVIPNLTSIHFDEELFPEPQHFNPDRFMADSSKSGDSRVAAQNSPDHVVPFSMGPRVCLGMAIARIEIFLFITSILQKLKIVPADPAVEPARRLGLIESPSKFAIRVMQRCDT